MIAQPRGTLNAGKVTFSMTQNVAAPLKVLVIGAGVIGTLYAVKLADAGNAVGLLARGDRLRELNEDGARIRNVRNGELQVAPFLLIEETEAVGSYDLVVVSVRKTQLESVLPLLVHCATPTILFLLNNPEDAARFLEMLGEGRVLLGFPGAGGSLQRGVVEYALIPQQPTTIGEPSMAITQRLRRIAQVLIRAGFRTVISRDMPAWLKTHAVFVTAVAGALYAGGGSAKTLALDHVRLEEFVLGVRRGFGALQKAGVQVTPWNLRLLFAIMPPAFAMAYWRRYFGSATAELVFARHALAASEEMAELVRECRALFQLHSVTCPEIELLWGQVETFADRAVPGDKQG